MNLSTEHPEYTATKASRELARLLYEAGGAVYETDAGVLIQETNEPDADYKKRLARAALDPWVEIVVTARQAMLFRNDHIRELPAGLSKYAQDVDMKGTPADQFFSQVVENAQVDGISWVLADMPTQPDGGLNTLAAEQRANHRPFFQYVPGANVLDWRADDGVLFWAVVAEGTPDVRERPGSALVTETRYKVWYPDHWELWQRSTSDEGTTYVIVGEGNNTSGVVPLVPFFGVKKTDFSGWPVTKTLHRQITLAFNKLSDQDWNHRLSAHPVLSIIAPENPEELNLSGGIYLSSEGVGDAKIEIKYLEPSGSASGQIDEAVARLERIILETALAQAQNDTKQVQSADSKRETRKLFDARLAVASRSAEASEINAWNVMSMWMGGPELPDKAVVYNRDFNDQMIAVEMIDRLKALAEDGHIREITFLNALAKSEVVDIKPEEELDGAKEEREEKVRTDFNAVSDVVMGPRATQTK